MEDERPSAGEGDKQEDAVRASLAGTRIQLVSQAVRLAGNAAATICLARLLVPRDFGDFAIALAVITFLQQACSAALSDALLAHGSSAEKTTGVAWTLAVGGAGVGFLAAALAYLALAPTTGVYSALLLVAGGNIVVAHHDIAVARAQIGLNFRTVASANMFGNFIGNVGAVIVALAGGGILALAFKFAVEPAVSASALMVRLRWVPHPSWAGVHVRSMVTHARRVALVNVMSTINRRGDDLFVGGVLGAVPLGFYNVAYRFIELPINQLGATARAVFYPAIVRFTSATQINKAYLRAQKVLLAVLTPISVGVVVSGDKIVEFVLGAQWIAAGGVARAFGAVAVVQAIAHPLGYVFLATKATSAYLRWYAFTVPLYIAGVLVGLPYGILGVAVGVGAAAATAMVLGHVIAARAVGLPLRDVAANILVPVASASAFATAGIVVREVWNLTDILSVLVVGAVAAAAHLVALARVDNRLRQDAMSILRGRKHS